MLWWARPCSVNLKSNFLLMGGLCSLPVVWIPFLTYASMLWLPGLWQSVPLILRQATVGPHLHWKLPDTHSKSGSVSCGGHCSFLLGPGVPCFVCAFQQSVFTVLCKFWRPYCGVNGDLLQEGLCYTQVCCIQSPCPCGRPLLTHTSAGDSQTLKGHIWLRLCGFSWCTQGFV